MAAITLAWLLSQGLGALVRRVTRRTDAEWDDVLVVQVAAPVRLCLAALVASPAVRALGLSMGGERVVLGLVRGVAVLSVLWMLLRATRVLEEALSQGTWGSTPQGRSLIPFIGRIVRAVIAFLGLLVALSLLGYPVSTLLAGLGLGGIALALASQKTIEHLFGSVSLAADRAFRVGDVIAVDGVTGTVEQIGLRSTAIRTIQRSLVRIPNGRLAEMRIENFGMRDRFLLEATLGLRYDTTMPRMARIRDAIEATIREHPAHWPDAVTVRFVRFGDSSLELLVQCWLLVADVAAFRTEQEALLARVHDIVVEAGARFAFPTRTLHVTGSVPPTPGVAAEQATLPSAPPRTSTPAG